MNDDDKLDAIAAIFDRDVSEITPETALDSLGWDSMAMLSVIALAKTRGVSLPGATVRAMATVADIMAVL